MQSRRWLVLATLGATTAAGWWMAGRSLSSAAAHTDLAAPAPAAVPPDGVLLETDITFYARRAAEDPQSAADRATLATLHLQRARATGGYDDYARAESLATQSLALRWDRNGEAVGSLAAALLARHAFVEAREVVQRADSLDPGQAPTVALLAEIELELGNYDAARRHFESVRHESHRATIGARLARWYEVTGRAGLARGILRRSIARLAGRDDLPREQLAWFHYRLGELELRSGVLDSAEAEFRRGLAVWPDDYRILGAMARLEAARGRWAEAIDFGDRAVAIQLDPTTLGVMSEAHAALGDSAQAAQWAQAMTVSALAQPGPIHRAWGLFLLDHGTAGDAREVLARSRRELRTRRDVYGYDLHAWALHSAGRHAEAREAMAHALAQGTEDPQLDFHAGAIAHAVGDSAAARRHLARALRVTPGVGVRQAARARALLDSLGAPPSAGVTQVAVRGASDA